MVLTTVLLAVSTFAVPVVIGTWSPTCNVAVWLSSTTSEGFDRTFTSVTLCSALRIRFGMFAGPSTRLRPGATALRSDDEPAVLNREPVLVVVAVPVPVIVELGVLLPPNCVPAR